MPAWFAHQEKSKHAQSNNINHNYPYDFQESNQNLKRFELVLFRIFIVLNKNMGDSFLWKTGTSTPFFIFFNPN